MSSPAKVLSTDAIEAFKVALAKFELRVQNAVDVLQSELHRTEGWLQHDRPSYWKDQLHQAEDEAHNAKIELERCLLFTLNGERPSCREQRAALDAAKRRVAYCREKGEAVKHWQRTFRQEEFEFTGRLGQLRRTLESDVPRARAVLEQIMRRLEEYQIERPPEVTAPAEPAGVTAAAPIQAPTSAGSDLSAGEPGSVDDAEPGPPVAALLNPEP